MPAPVEPGMMKGPWIDDAMGWGVSEGSGTGIKDGIKDERIGTMMSGRPALDGPADAEGVGVG
jgi:hypothetical protein